MLDTVHLPKRVHTALVACSIALGLTLLGATPALAAGPPVAVTLSATPSVSVGDTVPVSLGLENTDDVYAYEITLSFDPAVLSYVDGSVTGPTGGFDSVVKGNGRVTLVHTRLGTSPTLSGNIGASFSLSAIGSGQGNVTVTAVSLVNSARDTVPVTTQLPTAPVAVAAVVTPSATPSPSPSASAGSSQVLGAPSTDTPPGSLVNSGSTLVLPVALAAAAVAVALGGFLLVLRRKAARR